ncbi:hypothetical protein I4U23_023356 [Adineta vaga]|nr:hypothetical protein I4U23_023356 [Adineta vaga]
MNVTILPSSISQLQLASKHLSLTFAMPLCIFGILGNLINIVVFIDLGNYKHNASSLYIFFKTFCDLLVLIIGLGLRILNHSFRIDFSVQSRLWCKIRVALLEIGVFNSFTCLCLQSIDAYFSSSPSVVLRRKSQVQTARYLLIACSIFWISHQIPYVIFQDLIVIKNKPTCRTINEVFSQYRNYFAVIGFAAVIPVTVISIFGILTYRQLRALNRDRFNMRARRQSLALSHLTKQMTNMTLVHIIIVSLCEIPFAIVQVYSCATERMGKSALHQAREQLIQMIVVTGNYGTFASSFYCYCAASKRFRKQVVEAFTHFQCNGKNQPLSSSETISKVLNPQITTQI